MTPDRRETLLRLAGKLEAAKGPCLERRRFLKLAGFGGLTLACSQATSSSQEGTAGFFQTMTGSAGDGGSAGQCRFTGRRWRRWRY